MRINQTLLEYKSQSSICHYVQQMQHTHFGSWEFHAATPQHDRTHEMHTSQATNKQTQQPNKALQNIQLQAYILQYHCEMHSKSRILTSLVGRTVFFFLHEQFFASKLFSSLPTRVIQLMPFAEAVTFATDCREAVRQNN